MAKTDGGAGRGWSLLDRISEQLVAEIKEQIEEIDKVKFGDIIFRIQNGKLVTWDVRKTFKSGAGPKNGRLEA